LSQEALAERAHISTEAVGALERGTRKAPQRQTLALLVEALDLGAVDREQLAAAAVRPATPRQRGHLGELAGVASALRLPAALTSFVGRERDVADVETALQAARLVTLVGPGGVGKSRLAIESGRHVAASFEVGVALVELAPIGDPAAVVPAIAEALRVSEEGAVPLLDRIEAAVGTASRLLIIDNCEHLVEEVSVTVLTLLSCCEHMRIIATSREPLHVTGERVIRIEPLPIAPAVELFVDRATSVSRFLRFPSDKLDVVSDICRRVDGIPLAIELVASRTNVLEVETIRDRLRERFTAVATKANPALPHHRTLQTLVDWSHDLLDPEEVVAFRRLAIFAGGCRLDDAESILAFDGIAGDDVLDLLARLHDKSLVGVDRGDPPRFEMLQTIRDYAAQRLGASGEIAALGRRYAAHYIDLVNGYEPSLRGYGQQAAIDRISAEVDNLRAALVLSKREPTIREDGLRALGALALFWIRTGALTEGSAFIEAHVDTLTEPSIGLARACVGGAFLEVNRRRYALARVYAARANEAAAAVGDEWTVVYSSLVDFATRTVHRELDHLPGILASYERAELLGDPWLVGSVAYELAQLAVVRGDRQAAERHFTEVINGTAVTGDMFMLCMASLNLGKLMASAEPSRAARLIIDAFELLAPSAMFSRASCEEALASVALVLHRPSDAARLLGIASVHRRAGGGGVPSPVADRLRGRIDEGLFVPEFHTGESTALDEADEVVRYIAAGLVG